MSDIERMTINEYQLRMEAYDIQIIKRHENLAMQSWLNQGVQATTGKRNPKPKFKKFEDFFNSDAEIQKVRAGYEDDYEIENNKRFSKKEMQANTFADRLAEFNRLKKAGKIIPIEERREINGR